MSGRSLVPLGDCLSRASSWNPLRASADDVFRYIDLSSVDQDTKSISDAREVACGEAPSRARQLVVAGDVLVSTVRPNLNGVARVPSELDGATASTGFCVLRPEPSKLDGSYLFQWVKTSAFISDMVSKATGASYPAVSDRIIFESSIPLPPLEEQRRIAAILDQAETLRTQRRQALAHLDTLTQSLFLDMFGDPVTNPKGWKLTTIGELCEVKGGKRLPKGAEYSSTPTQYRYIRVTNLSNGQVDESELQYLAPEVQRSISRYTVAEGDVIISIAGSIGLIAPVSASLDGANLTENAAKLVSRRAGDYSPDFLAFMLRTKSVQDQIGSHVGQVTIGKLALFRIEKLAVPLPPLALQQTFATRIQAIETLKATHRTALAQLDALFASLQQRAFAGEL